MEFLDSYPAIKMILSCIGSILVIAQTIVFLTPSKADDAKLEGLLGKSLIKKAFDFFISFAPLQKKDGEIKMSKDA